jgi:hypothetical protein
MTSQYLKTLPRAKGLTCFYPRKSLGNAESFIKASSGSNGSDGK